VSAAVTCVPLTAFAPVHAPLAVQEVALVELQVNVDAPPLVILAGLADRVRVGAGTTVTVTDWLTLPLGPVQLRM
jgi:hypothetical protein